MPGQYYDAELDVFENWNRFYEPSLGRYLSPEPVTQSPAHLQRSAQGGFGVPTYGYGANNPVRFLDPSGLVFIDPTPSQRRAINKLKSNPRLADMMNYLDYSPDVQLRITEDVNDDTHILGKLPRTCGGTIKATININMLQAQFETTWPAVEPGKLGQFKDLFVDFSYADVLAHELGHFAAEVVARLHNDSATPFETRQNASDWFNISHGTPYINQ